MFAILRRSFPRLSPSHRRQSHAIRDPMAKGAAGLLRTARLARLVV